MGHDFIGRGWSFPLGVDATGRIATSGGDRKIQESIRLILGTARGERPMRPDFGCGIHDLVFAPAEPSTAGQIAYEVRIALEQWEPRIVVLNVGVSFARADQGLLLIDITYRAKGINDRRNLVFPFFVVPSNEPRDGGGLAAAPESRALPAGSS